MSTEMEGKYVAVIAAQAEENAKLRAALTRVQELRDTRGHSQSTFLSEKTMGFLLDKALEIREL